MIRVKVFNYKGVDIKENYINEWIERNNITKVIDVKFTSVAMGSNIHNSMIIFYDDRTEEDIKLNKECLKPLDELMRGGIKC